MKIRTIVGSLRAGSLSRWTANAVAEMAPHGVDVEPLSLRELPMYNGDLDVDGGPVEVAAFKASIAAADGLLIVTPEYNYGIPGVLKNALDWASRPAYQSVLAHRPVAMVGISAGFAGGARALGNLRQVLGGTLSDMFPYPETLIGEARTKFDESSNLTHAPTQERLAKLVHEFAKWIASRPPG